MKWGWDASTGTAPLVSMKNCGFKFGSTSQQCNFNSNVRLYGGSVLSGGSTPANGFCTPGADGRGGLVEIHGFDFSNCTAGVHVFGGGGATQVCRAYNCKMPTSWSGNVLQTASSAGANRYELLNYAASGTDVNYKFDVMDTYGRAKDESTIYRDSGGQDEATHYSIKLVTTANSSYPGLPFRWPLAMRVAADPGVTKTVTIRFVHDSATALKNNEIWCELEYLGTSGTPKSLFASDIQNVLVAGASQNSSSATWTGTGGFGTVQKLELQVPGVSFEENGYIIATVCLGKASTTVYVDPLPTIA
jgi:hypothetical protein